MKFFRLLAILLITGMIVSPATAQSPAPPFDQLPQRELPIHQMPAELRDVFGEGISVDDFIRNYRGPIPRALWPYTDLPLTVIVELEDEPLIPRLKALAVQGEDLAQVQSRHPELLSMLRTRQEAQLQRIARTNNSLRQSASQPSLARYSLVLNGYRMTVAANQITALEQVPGVKRVSLAREYTPNLTASVPLIKADQVWTMIDGNTGYTGKDITVAVIDTGIDYTHKMFGTIGDPNDYALNDPDEIEQNPLPNFPTSKVIAGIDLAGTNYDASNYSDPAVYTPRPDLDPLDEHGHGTHVASIIAGNDADWTSGVAPDVKLVAIKIFGASGSTNLVIDGIERAMDPNGDGFIDDKVDIANLSVGAPWGVADADDPEFQAVENAADAGVVMVISAGNEGDNAYISGSPGVSDSAITVASTSGSVGVSSFSSRGPRGYDSKLKPEISAPGSGIRAALIGSGNQVTSMSGTSMAAPHIAGVAALIREAHPGWSVQEIKAALMNTAVPFAPEVADITLQGSGLVDALAAVSTQVVAMGDPKLVSLSWGLIELGPDVVESFTKTVHLKNWGTANATYTVQAEFTSPSPGAAFNHSPSVTVPGQGGSATFNLELTLDPSLIEYDYANYGAYGPVPLPNEYAGYLSFTNTLDGKVLRLPFLAVVRPYATLTEVGAQTSFVDTQFGYASFVRHSGNLEWSGETATVYMESPNDPLFKDAAEVRYVGMDFAGNFPSFGNIAFINFAQWGPIHNPQPYFAEIDLIVDVDQDGNPDYSFFNFNELDLWGAGDANRWWLGVVNAETGTLAPANESLPIYADFNSGWQQWYIELDKFGIDGEASYLVVNYDSLGGEKQVGEVVVNLLEVPLISSVPPASSDPPNEFDMIFRVYDREAYSRNKPLGVMLLDAYGKPGVGQARFYPITLTTPTLFMPMIRK